MARRVKHTVRRHPKLVTQGINAASLLIAFGGSVGDVVRVVEGQANPVNLPHDIVLSESGVDINTGQINFNQLITSLELKAAGWIFNKAAKALTRHMRM